MLEGDKELMKLGEDTHNPKYFRKMPKRVRERQMEEERAKITEMFAPVVRPAHMKRILKEHERRVNKEANEKHFWMNS